MEKLTKNKKGFTLVEIIVVLIIMGILLAIAVPSVMGYVSRAEEQRDLATAHTGFVGAQSVVLETRAADRTATDDQLAAAITGVNVSAQTTPTTFNAVNCQVANGVIVQCSIQVTAGGQWANIVANGLADMAETATVTGPNTPAVAP